ncbi:hypothetical protein SK128_025313, partial [Halocaridina rubra]
NLPTEAATYDGAYPEDCIRVDSGFGYEGTASEYQCTTGLHQFFGEDYYEKLKTKPLFRMIRSNYSGFHLKHLQRAFGVSDKSSPNEVAQELYATILNDYVLGKGYRPHIKFPLNNFNSFKNEFKDIFRRDFPHYGFHYAKIMHDPHHACFDQHFLIYLHNSVIHTVCYNMFADYFVVLERIILPVQDALRKTKSCRNPFGMFDRPKCFRYGPENKYTEHICSKIKRCVDHDPVTGEILKYTPSGREIPSKDMLPWPNFPPLFYAGKDYPTFEKYVTVFSSIYIDIITDDNDAIREASTISEIYYGDRYLLDKIINLPIKLKNTRLQNEFNDIRFQNALYRSKYENLYFTPEFIALPFRNKLLEDIPRAFVVNWASGQHGHWIEVDFKATSSFQFYTQQYSDVTVGALFLHFRFTLDGEDGGFDVGLTPYFGLTQANYILELTHGHKPSHIEDYKKVMHKEEDTVSFVTKHLAAHLTYKSVKGILVPGERNRFQIVFDDKTIAVKVVKGKHTETVVLAERKLYQNLYPKWVRFSSQTIHRVGILGPPSAPRSVIVNSRDELRERFDKQVYNTGYAEKQNLRAIRYINEKYLGLFYETKIEVINHQTHISFSLEYEPNRRSFADTDDINNHPALIFTVFPSLDYASGSVIGHLVMKLYPPFIIYISFWRHFKADVSSSYFHANIFNAKKKNYLTIHMTLNILSIFFEHNGKMHLYSQREFKDALPPLRYVYIDAGMRSNTFSFRLSGISKIWESQRISANQCVPRRPMRLQEGIFYQGTMDFGYISNGTMDRCAAWHYENTSVTDYNYCRSYYEEEHPEWPYYRSGLWCFGIFSQERVICKDYCKYMPAQSLTGYEYRGDASVSRSGRPCKVGRFNNIQRNGKCEGDVSEWGIAMGPVCWVQVFSADHMADIIVPESCKVEHAFTFNVQGDAFEIWSRNNTEWLDMYSIPSGTIPIRIFPFKYWSKTSTLSFNFLTEDGAEILKMSHSFQRIQFYRDIIIKLNRHRIELCNVLSTGVNQIIQRYSRMHLLSDFRYFYIESVEPPGSNQRLSVPRLGIHLVSEICPRIVVQNGYSHVRRLHLQHVYEIDVIESKYFFLNFYNYPNLLLPRLRLKLVLSRPQSALVGMQGISTVIKFNDDRTFQKFTFEIIKVTFALWLELSAQLCPDVYGYPLNMKKGLEYISNVKNPLQAKKKLEINEFLKAKSLPSLNSITKDCQMQPLLNEWVMLIRNAIDKSVMLVISVKGERHMQTEELEFFNVNAEDWRVSLNIISNHCKRSNVSFIAGKDGEWRSQRGECVIGANGLGLRSVYYTCVGINAFGTTCQEPADKSNVIQHDFPNSYETSEFCGTLRDDELSRELAKVKFEHEVKIYKEGDNDEIACNNKIKDMIDGSDAYAGTAAYTWYKDNDIIATDNLTLVNVTAADGGLYQCFVKIGIGKIYPIRTIGVIIRARRELGLYSDTVVLRVNISTYRTHINATQQVTWYLEPLYERLQVIKIPHKDTINFKVSRETQGIYTACMADKKPLLCFYRVKIQGSSAFLPDILEEVFAWWLNIDETVFFTRCLLAALYLVGINIAAGLTWKLIITHTLSSMKKYLHALDTEERPYESQPDKLDFNRKGENSSYGLDNPSPDLDNPSPDLDNPSPGLDNSSDQTKLMTPN